MLIWLSKSLWQISYHIDNILEDSTFFFVKYTIPKQRKIISSMNNIGWWANHLVSIYELNFSIILLWSKTKNVSHCNYLWTWTMGMHEDSSIMKNCDWMWYLNWKQDKKVPIFSTKVGFVYLNILMENDHPFSLSPTLPMWFLCL